MERVKVAKGESRQTARPESRPRYSTAPFRCAERQNVVAYLTHGAGTLFFLVLHLRHESACQVFHSVASRAILRRRRRRTAAHQTIVAAAARSRARGGWPSRPGSREPASSRSRNRNGVFPTSPKKTAYHLSGSTRKSLLSDNSSLTFATLTVPCFVVMVFLLLLTGAINKKHHDPPFCRTFGTLPIRGVFAREQAGTPQAGRPEGTAQAARCGPAQAAI